MYFFTFENFSAVWVKVFWNISAVSDIVLEKNTKDSKYLMVKERF